MPHHRLGGDRLGKAIASVSATEGAALAVLGQAPRPGVLDQALGGPYGFPGIDTPTAMGLTPRLIGRVRSVAFAMCQMPEHAAMRPHPVHPSDRL